MGQLTRVFEECLGKGAEPIKREPTTFGLDTDKLARILGICAEPDAHGDRMDQEQEKAELLHQRLAQALPSDTGTIESLPKILGKLRQAISAAASEPIGKLLLNPKTELRLIRQVKEYAKSLSKHSEGKPEYQTASTIYHCALAHALVNHNEKITSYSYDELGEAFSYLIKEKWIPGDLLELLKEARKHCEQAERNRK